MAKRVQELCAVVDEEYGGDAARLWTDASDSADLRRRIGSLPGFGEMKIKALGSVLSKRFDVTVADGLVPGHPTLGDVDSREALERYQAAKREYKAKLARQQAACRPPVSVARRIAPQPIPRPCAASPPLALAALLPSYSPAPRPAAPLPARAEVPGLPGDERVEPARRPLPVAANSDAIVRSIGVATGLHPDFGSGLVGRRPDRDPDHVVVGTKTPAVAGRVRVRRRERPGPVPDPGERADRGRRRPTHALVVDRDACKLYELVRAHPQRRRLAGRLRRDLDLRSNALRPDGWTSADAAGLPILPGLARYDEVARGRDRPRAALHGPAHAARRTSTRPATTRARSTDPTLPPMGLRLRLKASFDIERLPARRRGSCSRRSSATG